MDGSTHSAVEFGAAVRNGLAPALAGVEELNLVGNVALKIVVSVAGSLVVENMERQGHGSANWENIVVEGVGCIADLGVKADWLSSDFHTVHWEVHRSHCHVLLEHQGLAVYQSVLIVEHSSVDVGLDWVSSDQAETMYQEQGRSEYFRTVAEDWTGLSCWFVRECSWEVA